MLRPLLIAATFALGTTAGTASAWIAKNDLIVKSTGENSFEVAYRGRVGASDFWCAAGDYVYRSLNLASNTRIYRTSAPPRRAGQGITFSLAPVGATRTGLIQFGNQRGVSVSHARTLCETNELLRN
ncbi:hypothetical protein N9C96_00350 [bacterium]|nr:hypothetical protein [bacterium]